MQNSGLTLLKDISRIDNGRLGIPVYFSVCDTDAYNAIGNFKQMGKGATPEQAQASAVMELGERFSLFSFLKNPDNFIKSTAQNLDNLDNLKKSRIDFKHIARSVDETSNDLEVLEKLFGQLPLTWTWAHNLTSGETVMIPFNWFFTINEFNGSSAGNCNEEAICQGICEVIERHTSAIVSKGIIKPPNIDINSISDPVARQLIEKYQSAGIELCLSDFTADMGVPTIGALAWDPATFPEKSEIVWTAGTMPDATKALCRALTEVAQLAGDFNSGGNYVASGLPKLHSLKEAHDIIYPGKRVDLGNLPDLSHQNIKTEVENCIQALAKRNMDVFLLDIRHPLLDIPAFYTIIPGTQFRERAQNANVGMICGKIISESLPASHALTKLYEFDRLLPDRYYFKFYMGQLQLNTGCCTEAIQNFHQALELDPAPEDHASIYTYLGMALKETQQYKEAIKALSKADQIDTQRTDTLNLMGFCHFKLKNHAQALECFQKVVTLDPSSAIDYANIAVNYRAMGQKNKAAEFYQLALALDPGIDFARNHLIEMGIEE
ncbi:MAG: tetratricopeptide repeat protein [Desulfobacteraceae bacterium]|nr:tetratricopeptide repeat protein [Desulfobacteraceae bacterium]